MAAVVSNQPIREDEDSTEESTSASESRRMDNFDVIIVGAGVAGIGAAYRLSAMCPEKSFVVFEARDQMGGTWDVWRYSGVRSDSDMFTFAYPFKPWNGDVVMAPGGSINDYLKSAAAECGADKHVRCGHRVQEAAWSSEKSTWTIQTTSGMFTSSFLFLGAGYYEYDDGYNPEFKGRDRFNGPIVNPIKWPRDLDYASKRIVVIGSGATAVSVVPELAKTAGHVTMLQRSPTYLYSAPNNQGLLHNVLRKLFPNFAAKVARWTHIAFTMVTYWVCRKYPKLSRAVLIKSIMKLMPGQDKKHFTPRYNPWDERVCRVSDGDFCDAVNKGTVSVVTDHIDTFTETSVLTTSGDEIPADIIVSATGFNFMRNYPVGSIKLSVDGKPYDANKTFMYKGCMLSEIPNLFYACGYTNASWTMRTDLISLYFCQMVKHMDKHGIKRCFPPVPDASVKREPGKYGTLSSGYLVRSKANMPMQGDRLPWYAPQYYLLDKLMLVWRPCDDGIIKFVGRDGSAKANM